VQVAALFLFVQVAAAPAIDCRDGQLSMVTSIRELLDRGDNEVARRAVASLPPETSACVPLEIARLSVMGWFEARTLAAAGGATEKQGPVQAILGQLEMLRERAVRGSPVAIEIEYAQTIIRAAISAAQDERAEMELLLGHARDLVQRLESRSVRALWPRPYNAAAGELWFEVDRYDEARAAFERAVQSDGAAVALVGLARSLARANRFEEACATFKRAVDASPELRASAKNDLARCR
jgi:tetratricopeptide (TPR) repeat protein